MSDADPLLEIVSLVSPASSLVTECKLVLDRGYVRGADLWHLATAVFIAGPYRDELLFISLDDHQRAQAQTLGFGVWPKN